MKTKKRREKKGEMGMSFLEESPLRKVQNAQKNRAGIIEGGQKFPCGAKWGQGFYSAKTEGVDIFYEENSLFASKISATRFCPFEGFKYHVIISCSKKSSELRYLF